MGESGIVLFPSEFHETVGVERTTYVVLMRKEVEEAWMELKLQKENIHQLHQRALLLFVFCRN